VAAPAARLGDRTFGWAPEPAGWLAALRSWPWAVLPPALLALVVRIATGAHPIDDAYITYRYARNVARGVGLVYTPGESVLGTTAPLWALFLGAFHRATGLGIPELAATTSAFADAAGVAVLALLARRLTGSTALAAVGASTLALAPASIEFATGGMETSVFTLLLLLCLLWRDRPRVWPLLAAAATLLRPEAAILAACLVATGGRAALRGGLLYLGALLPWLVYAVATYGSPIPHSVIAKSSPVYRREPLGPVVVLFWATLAIGPGLPLAGLLVPIALLRRGLARRVHVLWLFPGAFLAFHLLGAARGANLFGWYLVPILPWLVLLALLGCATLRKSASTPGARAAAALTAICLIAGNLLAWNLGRDPHLPLTWQRPPVPGIWGGREDDYRAAARYLALIAPDGATVAAPEIGAIGWEASHLRVLDTVGLVSPRALRYYPLPTREAYGVNNAVPAELLRRERPDYVLSLEVFLRPVLRDDPSALDGYVLERVWPSDAFGSRGLLLYRRA
jgi:arabinofuranosyltransferase